MNALRGLVITTAGRDLLVKLAATGRALILTRVLFGAGKPPPGATIADFQNKTALIAPIAEGTSTTPIFEHNQLSMVLEFRSDMHGGLSHDILINEYGVYASDPDGSDLLLLYGNLGDCPDTVAAYQPGMITTRGYPLSIAITSVPDVRIDFAASAFLTSQEANDLLESCIRRTVRMTAIDVSIPVKAWQLGSEHGQGGRYPYYADVNYRSVRAIYYPQMTLQQDSLTTAFVCGLSPLVTTSDGGLRFYAQQPPTETISGVCQLWTEGGDNPTEEGDAVLLELENYTGETEIAAMVDGVFYDAVNMATDAQNAPDGTILVTRKE